jgi:hypothetical protein
MVAVYGLVQPVRKCGKRKEHSFYLVSSETSRDGILPNVSDIEDPIPMLRAPHRGPLAVDGDIVLARYPEEEWLVGASADTQEKNKSDRWAKNLFGMTLTKRLQTGECKGTKTAEEALDVLVSKVTWNSRLLDVIRQLTLNKVAELPNATEPFLALIRHTQDYGLQQDAQSLVEAAGAAWRLAAAVQPRHRVLVVNQVATVLMYLGLMKDALEVRKTFRIPPED